MKSLVVIIWLPCRLPSAYEFAMRIFGRRRSRKRCGSQLIIDYESLFLMVRIECGF